MKKLWLLSVSMLLVGLMAGSTLNLVANSASDDAGVSKDQYAKLTNAILSLHKRLTTLESTSKSGKSTSAAKGTASGAGEDNKDAQDLKSKLAQTQSEVASLKSQISGLRAEATANREAIMVLHKRLTLLDSKSGTIKF